MVKLGEVCEIVVGRTPARADNNLWGTGHPWLSIRDMSQGIHIALTKEQITDAGAKNGKLVNRGTVLLSFKLSIGRVAIAGIPLYTNEAIAALPILDEKVLFSRYLLRALEYLDLGARANRAAMGATLNKASLREISIPLPSLSEQRRIAAILDQADAIRAKRRRMLDRLEALTQSIFLEVFGHVGVTTTVEEVAYPMKGSIRTGPFGSQLLHSEFVDTGIAVLGLDNVVGNEFRWEERRFITRDKYSQLERYTVHPGDVLISIMGTTGRCVVVPPGTPTAINTKHICAITPDPEKIESEFLRAAFLWHPKCRSHILRQTKGSVMDGLNMGIIKSMPVPNAPLRRQTEFARVTEEITTQRATIERALAADDEQFASIQYRAFRGEL